MKWTSSKVTAFICVCVLTNLLLAGTVIGQKTWDGSSDANWGTAANWTPAGVPLAGDDVVIPNNFNVTVNVAAVCASLTLQTGGNTTTLSVNAGQSLTVSGAVSIEAGTGANDDKIITVGSGSFSCASLTMATTGGPGRDCELRISTGTATVSGNITMNGTADRNAIRFSGNGTLHVGGSINSGGDINIAVGCTVNYNGAGPQTVKADVYRNLVFSGGGEKTLAGQTTVRTVCSFVDGIVNTTAVNLLVINDNATVTGASDNSFANGPVRKVGNDVFPFPIGKTGAGYAPLAISAPSASNHAFDAEYFWSPPPAGTIGLGIDHISGLEYWDLDQTTGASSVFVSLSWRDLSEVSIPSELLIVRLDAGQWVSHGNGGATGDATAGAVVTAIPPSTYSFFALASSTAANPLPVTWLDFRASVSEEKEVELVWSTGSESNNKGFGVERSSNANDWETIAFVPGAGTTSEKQNYSYTDKSPVTSHQSLIYYRLKQTDFSGAFEYSPLRFVEITNPQGVILVYPNPTDTEATISFSEPTEVQGLVRVYTQNNRFVLERVIPIHTSDYVLPLAQLPGEAYILQVVVGRKQWSKRLVVD
ncbi:MAG: T9SS type A sorting domain-containing protein [Saprospirales bacterium]|nr:T9SS type A sorting domain-containing protein [Saprospirales bacterium]